MTVVPNPLPRLTRFRILLILAVVGIAVSAAVPTTLYWTLQRTDLHARWQLEANYARQFGFQMEYVSSLVNGTVYKWNNVTSSLAGNLMGYANENLNYLLDYDTAHGNQLYQISYAIENIVPSFFNLSFANLSSAQRGPLAAQLYSLGDRILYSYWNFLKYTSAGGISGPPFWYSGPSPPDEQLLQVAVSIALALRTPT